MNLAELARVLLRWRWLIAPVLVVAVLAGGLVYRTTPPTWSQTERFLLLSPVVTEQGPGNPFLQLGNGVSMAAGVLMTKVAAGQTAAGITDGVPGASFTIAGDPATAAPVVVVVAEGPQRADVARVLDRVGEQLVVQLAQLQQDSGAPQISWVTISQLTRDPSATPVDSARLRAAAVSVLGVLVVGLLLLLLLERRRRGRAADGASREQPGGVAEDPLQSATGADDRTVQRLPERAGSADVRRFDSGLSSARVP
ncbi:hypothetical protein GB931_16240 [Modestobacter sp. I12A-02628]|uniref:Capsular polysaccharide biosynthesis protein n=1 Tax=Goekera deserti TaxID=2497753 RepID=A0A7K3WGI1_9ACTN|nr:hypothetical protein [Goekera deserti]MPQ99438.1 hypothetical protein [Goekera deserti]NDI48925.1 hypothetical protein [Goekera deserti]NEL55605.1 hypothetical protein [Goekera deserti]